MVGKLDSEDPRETQRVLEDLYLDFEDAWETASPSIEEYLLRVDEPNREEALKELTLVDLERRIRADVPITISEYQDRFPSLGSDKEFLSHLQVEEARLRRSVHEQKGFPKKTKSDETLVIRGDRDTVGTGLRSNALSSTNGGFDSRFVLGTLVDHYEIKDVVGEGAFSIVYRARDKRLDRDVAIKFLAHSVRRREEMQERLRIEAIAQGNLNHRGISPVFDCGTHQELPYIVTGFVDGETLEQIFDSRGESFQKNPLEAVALVREVCGAVQHAHERRVIHRDIKPANVIVNEDCPVLIDFGLAYCSDSNHCLTHDGDVIGTPAYMSPEQARGTTESVDARSDVYSIGAMLFQLVCGILPFTGRASEVVYQVLNRIPPDPSKHNNLIGSDLRTVILKCLEKEPSDRYQSAAQLQEDLRRVEKGENILARPPNTTTKATRWVKRNPLTTVLAMSLGFLCVFLAGVATSMYRAFEEMERATKAETVASQLLSQTSYDAGVLAFQRGQIALAIKHFEAAVERDPNEEAKKRLALVNAYYWQRSYQSSLKQLRQASIADDCLEVMPSLLRWQAEFALRGEAEFGAPYDLLSEAHRLAPENADGLYAKALLAESTDDGIAAVKEAISADPYHFHARQMLVVSLLSLGRFEEAGIEIKFAQEMHPGNVEFQLLQSIALVCRGELKLSESLIETVDLEARYKIRWVEFLRLTSELASGLKGLRDNSGRLSLNALASALQAESQFHWNTLSERQWRLPLAVTEGLINALADTKHRKAGLHALDGEQWEKLVSAHSESTLCLAYGDYLLDQIDYSDSSEQEALKLFGQARKVFEDAIVNPGLLQEDDEYANYGILSISALERLKYEHDVETNDQRFRDYSPLVSPLVINRISPTRLYGIAALRADERTEAQKWFSRARQLAIESQNIPAEVDAIFHLALIARRNEEWMKVVELCSQCLELDGTRQDAANFRAEAVNKIETLVSRVDVEDPA